MNKNQIIESLEMWDITEESVLRTINKRSEDSYIKQALEDLEQLKESEFYDFVSECWEYQEDY